LSSKSKRGCGANWRNDKPSRIGSPAGLDNAGFEPLFNPKPGYPPAALEACVTGYVNVNLVINADGDVKSFSFATINRHPAYGNAVAEVLPRWRFPLPRIGGKKTGAKYVYRINFTLN
jgi:TonB family protein